MNKCSFLICNRDENIRIMIDQLKDHLFFAIFAHLKYPNSEITV